MYVSDFLREGLWLLATLSILAKNQKSLHGDPIAVREKISLEVL